MSLQTMLEWVTFIRGTWERPTLECLMVIQKQMFCQGFWQLGDSKFTGSGNRTAVAEKAPHVPADSGTSDRARRHNAGLCVRAGRVWSFTAVIMSPLSKQRKCRYVQNELRHTRPDVYISPVGFVSYCHNYLNFFFKKLFIFYLWLRIVLKCL